MDKIAKKYNIDLDRLLLLSLPDVVKELIKVSEELYKQFEAGELTDKDYAEAVLDVAELGVLLSRLKAGNS